MEKSDDEQYLQTSVPSVIRKGLSGLIGITSFGNAEKKGKAFDCDFAKNKWYCSIVNYSTICFYFS